MVMAPRDIKPFPMPTGPRPLPGGPFEPGGPRPIPGGCIPPQTIDFFQFSAADKNRDGDLSLDEWVKSKRGEVTMADIKKFERYDADGNGKVSKDEYMAGRKLDRWLKDAADGIKDGWKQHVVPLMQKVGAAAKEA